MKRKTIIVVMGCLIIAVGLGVFFLTTQHPFSTADNDQPNLVQFAEWARRWVSSVYKDDPDGKEGHGDKFTTFKGADLVKTDSVSYPIQGKAVVEQSCVRTEYYTDTDRVIFFRYTGHGAWSEAKEEVHTKTTWYGHSENNTETSETTYY